MKGISEVEFSLGQGKTGTLPPDKLVRQVILILNSDLEMIP